MKRKRLAALLSGLILGAALWGNGTPASAHGNIWMDEHQGVADKDFVAAKDYRKILLFPIRYKDEPDGKVDAFSAYNEILYKRASKRIRKTNVLRFEDPGDAKQADQSREQRYILRDDSGYQKLLQHFPTEQERAKAVYDSTGAQGYLLPYIRWDGVRVDTSPTTWTRVRMESYYNIVNGPKGNQSGLGYQAWIANHQIPARSRTLQMVDMDFTLVDAYTGKASMTLVDYYRVYDVDETHAIDQIAKNFTGDWNRLKGDHDNKAPANAPTLGFQALSLPENALRDAFLVRTIGYAYTDEAGDTLKGVRVRYTPGDGDYLVRGSVTACNRGQTWHRPYATTHRENYKNQKFKWVDDQGNEHEGQYRYYRTRISDHFGYYSFWYRVAAHLELVNAHTGEVVLTRDVSADDPDRYANALRSIFHDFYKDVDRAIGVKAD